MIKYIGRIMVEKSFMGQRARESVFIRTSIPEGWKSSIGLENFSHQNLLARAPRTLLLSFIVNKTSLTLSHSAGARSPRGGVTRQGVVLTDLQSLLDCP